MGTSLEDIINSSGEHEKHVENVTYMNASLYKAAAEGNIEVFNNHSELALESQKTPNNDNVLHVNLATHELAACLSNGILSRTRSFPDLYFFIFTFLSNYIIKKKSEKRLDFIEQILGKCPSLLLQTNAKGQTPLHVAARYGHSAIVKLLIRSCAKARDGDLEKLEMGQVNAVREMLRITDQESNTALHLAAQYGDIEMVEGLLELEGPDFPYSANQNQETPLYLAAKRGNGDVVRILLDKSKSTGHRGPHRRTLLHAAAMGGSSWAIMVILEKKGNLTKETDEDGHTPLHYAAHIGWNPVVKILLKKDVSAAYMGDKKLGMTPLLMAARQGFVGTVKTILSYCPDCCEKVDQRGLNLLHYLVFRDKSRTLNRSLFMPAIIITEYGSIRNLMKLQGDFGFTPEEVYHALRYEGDHEKYLDEKKQIQDLLKDIALEEVAEIHVLHIPLSTTVSTESLEKTKNAHLVVAALIATVAFAVAITVPGGLKSGKGSEQGTPLLIDEAAFKAFVVTNAMAFLFSVFALTTHLGVLENILSRFSFWHETVLYRTQMISGLLGYATIAMVIAFSTGSYVILKPSRGLTIVSCLICPTFLLAIVLHVWLVFNVTFYEL
ncbi:ankyrin repeat-containing protein At5g02620-like [Gossypium arboreum]|uniref:ankyrin repeat-containing protein At5g02620-like n=1 Tax=Gossypium arboreum TaxID=29729 RepID=UPI0008196CF5|nr:ankyrin repeat-containing protein At5g02620-like [Gossypium arboreum]